MTECAQEGQTEHTNVFEIPHANLYSTRPEYAISTEH